MTRILIALALAVMATSAIAGERDDTGDKLVEYFAVASIQHYLIVNPGKRVVVHHQRQRRRRVRTPAPRVRRDKR